MTYQESINYLFSRLPMYQRMGATAYKKDIGNIVLASNILKNPEKKFKSIHIAGTNGKGSVAHMVSSILQENNYKVGLYTSPHLKDFRERIKINGVNIDKKKVTKFITKNKLLFEKIDLSFFEFTVAMAFNYFAESQVDIAVIETGLGGRLDSTNIINPEISVITNISYDHTNLLGNTITKIAKEKAGIIKKNTPLVIGRKQQETFKIFEKIAKAKKAKIIYSKINNFQTDLKGNYQQENVSTSITIIKELIQQGWNINEKSMRNGLCNVKKNTSLKGRWQVLNQHPTIICDTAHNEDGIKEAMQQLKSYKHQQLHIVYGTVSDKNFEKILQILPNNAIYYFCTPNVQRGLNTKKLNYFAKKHGLNGMNYTSVKSALKSAKNNSKKDDLIFIGGSIFVVAEII